MTYNSYLQNFLGDSGDLSMENGLLIFTISESGVGGKWTLVKIHDDFVILNSDYSECIPTSSFIIKYRKK
ncbi:MAG: hypothetical protein ABI723_07335 [Bacteroidia bacterium]